MNTTQQQPAIGQPAISTGSMLTQVSGVLAAIIILILACAWWQSASALPLSAAAVRN